MKQINTTREFITYIKQKRLEKELSQAQLGEMVGLSQKQYARIENMDHNPNFEILFMIMNALNIKVELGEKSEDWELL